MRARFGGRRYWLVSFDSVLTSHPAGSQPGARMTRRPQHVFFTGDQHWCHRAIISMCGRPFADVDDMDQAMIDAWNSVVHSGDIVWHLGDFAHRGKADRVRSIFEALNGIKCLVV